MLSWKTRPRTVFLLLCLWLAAVPALRAEGVLEQFPLVVRSGLASVARRADPLGLVLADLPFSNERGYGYVGGHPGRLESPALVLDRTDGPVAWREGVEKYVFRVPRGEYIVELSFVETAVWLPGLRVFDVIAEDRPLFSSLDIARDAGDFAWVTRRGLVSVRDGWLDLRFVSSTPGMPPRVSTIRLLRGALPGAPAPPAVRVHGGIGVNMLEWNCPGAAAPAGYGLFRARAAAGPYESLTDEPVRAAWFGDWGVEPGTTYFYKVCSYDVRGGQGPYSRPAAATPRSESVLGLKTYDLRVPPDALRRIGVRQSPAPEVPGELRYLGAVYFVNVRCDTSRRGWQRKKSFDISLQLDRNRSFGRRRALRLEAQSGDPTRLCAKLFADAAGAMGLAAAHVEPVVLRINGRFQGLYFDTEIVNRRFRKRARLDRVGLLARMQGNDALRLTWDPYGKQIGEAGNLWSLTKFLHEINGIGTPETEAYLGGSLYLDRFLDRLLLCALRGERSRGAALDALLRDSRNGQWEFFRSEAGSSAPPYPTAGSRGATVRSLSDREARRLLFGASILDGGAAPGRLALLESRFFHQPALRRRFLERLEQRTSGILSPGGFAEMVDAAAGATREAALEDAALWRESTSRGAVVAAPQRIRDAYSAVVEGLLHAARAGASPVSTPLVINELLAAPLEGDPWVEIRNVSTGEVRLEDYGLVNRFAFPVASRSDPGDSARLSGKALRPGECRVFKLRRGETVSLSAPQRFLALCRLESSRPGAASIRRPVDFVLAGHPTPGVSCGRLSADSGRWGVLASPTPGAPNEVATLQSPPVRYRQGVKAQAGGAYTIWLQTRRDPGAAENRRPAKVTLRYRPRTERRYRELPMPWDEENLRFAVELRTEGTRTDYYFLAASADGVERVYPLPAPSLTFSVGPLPPVKINEVLPRPTKDPSSPGEFVELYNTSESPVDLGGYFLTDSKRNPTKWRLPSATVIGPRAYLVLYADGRNFGLHTSFKLSNAGEYLALHGRMEEGNLLVDRMAFRGVNTGWSWGASPDGSKNFRVWKDPTPGARNQPKIPEEYLKKRDDKRGR